MLTILRSLIQSRLDYCSQLWSPRDQRSINLLESVQRNFINKIRSSDLIGKTYWEKLKILRVYSQERRRERYMICLLWKISQGLTDGISVTWQYSERRGRYAIPVTIRRNANHKVKKAREQSLSFHGALLFNLLPIGLRNENCGDFDLFKNHLDLFLSEVPDQPTVSGLVRAAKSNSLLDQVPLMPEHHY